MLNKAKIKIATVAIVAILVSFISTTSLAYYSNIGKATNVVTSGNVKLKIHETTDQGTEFPEEGVYVVPGDVISKKVTIENICDHPFYLRVKLVSGIDSTEVTLEDSFKLNINKKYWKLHEDGWYYYKKAVKPEETTKHVFSHVEIVGSKVDNSYIGKTLTITVDAQAVQSENNPLTDGKIYTAKGWPKEGE